MSRTTRRKPRTELRPVRNWLAVDARTRHTAGNMGDKRKEKSRYECRKWKHKPDSDDQENNMGYRSDWKIVFNTYKKTDHVLNCLKDFVVNNSHHEAASLLEEMLAEAIQYQDKNELHLGDEGWKLYSWECALGVIGDLFDDDPEVDFASVRLGEEHDDNDVRCGDDTYLYIYRGIGDVDVSPVDQFVPQEKIKLTKETCDCPCTIHGIIHTENCPEKQGEAK